MSNRKYISNKFVFNVHKMYRNYFVVTILILWQINLYRKHWNEFWCVTNEFVILYFFFFFLYFTSFIYSVTSISNDFYRVLPSFVIISNRKDTHRKRYRTQHYYYLQNLIYYVVIRYVTIF